MKLGGIVVAAMVLILSGCSVVQDGNKETVFSPNVESLRQYKCPEWFRDAKFGIYCHWNPQSSVKSPSTGWYARHMYDENRPEYKEHLQFYGHPSEFGYKDIIREWKADKFNADEWVKLFKKAGAKYIVAMAVHHDNFDMWDSKYQPKWNSMNYGPKTDVVGAIRKATLKEGLRFGVTTHLARTYSWLNTSKGADKQGPYAGVPYDGNDPAYKDLYLEKHDDINNKHPVNPPESWRNHWKNRIIDLIDKYHPDHLWFDGALPFNNDGGQAGMDVVAHYYNHNAKLHGGKNEGVMCIKNYKAHGFYYEGAASLNYERSRSAKILDQPWQTDTSIGPWFYSSNAKYRSVTELIHELVDIVSKNGNVLLNVGPKGDGSFDEKAIETLEGIGQWLSVNGQAIYKTRPWKVFGEDNVRYTTNGKVLYATVLKWQEGQLTLNSTKGWKPEDVKSVKLVGFGKADWSFGKDGLTVDVNKKPKAEHAFVLKISCNKPLSQMPAGEAQGPSSDEANKKAEKFGLDGQGGGKLGN